MCTGIDRLRADGTDCTLPPVTADLTFATVRSGIVATLLPAEVARVRFPGGREVATVEGGYSGRFAGAVRFLMTEAAAVEPHQRVRMLDAAGAVIGTLAINDPSQFEPSGRAAQLAAGSGWRLTARRSGLGEPCLIVHMRGFGDDCVGTGATSLYAIAGCTPRKAVVYGSVARGIRSVRAELRGGLVLRARIVRLPRRVGRGRAFVLALPRGARVDALRIGGRLITFPVLPAARQCGYRAFAPIDPFGAAEPELEIQAP